VTGCPGIEDAEMALEDDRGTPGISGVRETLRCSGSVLAVSGDVAEVAFFAFALKRRGHAVTTATSCEAARAAAEGQRFHVLVIADALPDGSGRDLADELGGAAGIGVVLVVAASDERSHAVAGTALTGYGRVELTHPVPVVALIQSVDALLTAGPERDAKAGS
jgi:DNA-binding response OmpR family regulator